jgi:CheY-like chemotaxis protein
MKSRAIKKSRRTPQYSHDRSRFLAASHDSRQSLHALGLFVAQLRSFAHDGELKRIVEQIDTSVCILNERFSRLLEIASTLNGGNRTEAESAPACVLLDRIDGKVIVVIDDDPLALDGACGLLRSWGSTVVTGDSGSGALAALLKHQRSPDLIISDVRLSGGKTGIDAIAQLRGAFTDAIPALLVSRDAGPEPAHEARASGLLLLHKPVDPMRLRAVLSRVLKGTS